MRHSLAILIKYVVIAIVLFSILPIFSTASLTEIFIISLLVTGTAYVIGDLYILPKFGNVIATIADFGLATVSIWGFSAIFIGQGFRVLTAALFGSVFIALSEALFHVYMKEKVLTKTETVRKKVNFPTNLQTEFAEENDVREFKEKQKQKENNRS